MTSEQSGRGCPVRPYLLCVAGFGWKDPFIASGTEERTGNVTTPSPYLGFRLRPISRIPRLVCAFTEPCVTRCLMRGASMSSWPG